MHTRCHLFCLFVLSLLPAFAFAQDSGETDNSYLSGSLETNGNFFLRDSAIGAANTPQYDHQLFGAEAWLNLRYQRSGYEIGVRFDVYQQSNLPNPTASYSAQGIGRWYIKKRIAQLAVEAGYLYDQIGSGIIYRAYEERPLAIDNALLGVRLDYDLSPDWRIKVFSGKQKQQFANYDALVKGAAIDGFVGFGGDSAKANVSLAAGFGVVQRTLDDETVTRLTNTISTYTLADSLVPTYNTLAFTAYNTLSAGKWTWYVEGAVKTAEVYFDPNAEKNNRNGELSAGKFVRNAGTVLYSTLSFASEKFGISLEAKRTQGFTFRATPFATLNRAMINFLPPVARQNTYRLTTRYNAATQELGEQAVQLDIKTAPSEHLNIDANVAVINNLNNELLYRELYVSALYKPSEAQQWTFGVQFQQYNQQVYEVKPNAPVVKTVTPFVEYYTRLGEKRALRIETQFLSTEQDKGSLAFALIEYSVAPHWIFTLADMYNLPYKTASGTHYPTVLVGYTQGSSRFTLSFVKQIEGVVCTGGVCRFEPAFSGVKVGVNTTF
jgi:Family of unknown function (DUF6029)